MNEPSPDRGDLPDDPGAATAQDGTPVAVDLGTAPRSRTTMALFLAGPVILMIHFLLVYLVVEAGCTGEGPGLRVFQPPVAGAVTLGATAVAAIACLASAVVAYRRWRTDRPPDAQAPTLAASEEHGALLFAGFVLSLLGVVTILFVGLPALVLPTC